MGRSLVFSASWLCFGLLIQVGCSETSSSKLPGVSDDTDSSSESDSLFEGDSSGHPDEQTGPKEYSVSGTTYYVDSETGDDQNDGQSRENAFKTLHQGQTSLSSSGGDKLVIKGTFQETLVMNDLMGTSEDQRTVVQCDFDNDGNPLPAAIDGGLREVDFPFDRNGLPSGFGPGEGNYLSFGIYVRGAKYLTISGISVKGIAGRGVWLLDVDHSLIEWMEVTHTSNTAIRVAIDSDDHTDPKGLDTTIRYNRTNHTNLGHFADKPESGPAWPDIRSETITVSGIDGFSVHNNHLSNSFQEGIDFKFGSSNGVVRNNLIENTRAAGIYCNEGRQSDVFQNVIRHVGWYDPEDGSGLQLAADYQRTRWEGNAAAVHGTGILVGNGDLNFQEYVNRESGEVFDVRVFENLIIWTLKGAISTSNEWEVTGRSPWRADNIHIYNNTTYKTNQGAYHVFDNTNPGSPVYYPTNSAAIVLANSLLESSAHNNIMAYSPRYGLNINYLDEVDDVAYYASNSVSHNLWHQCTGPWPKHYGTEMIFDDPRFVLESTSIGDAGNFQVHADSPAVGSGTDVGSGTPVDMGAFPLGEDPWIAGIPTN